MQTQTQTEGREIRRNARRELRSSCIAASRTNGYELGLLGYTRTYVLIERESPQKNKKDKEMYTYFMRTRIGLFASEMRVGC